MRGFLRSMFRPGRVLALVLMLAVLPGMPHQPAEAQAQGATIRLVPANSQISPGGIVKTEVRLEGVSNLVAVDFRLRFDPNILEVVDSIDPSQPAREIEVGRILQERGAYQHRNEVWNDQGFIDFDYFLPPDAEPINESFAVALIIWRGDVAGTSNLTFEPGELELSNSDGIPIEARIENGQIVVVADTATPRPTETSPPPDTPTLPPPPTDTPIPAPTDTPIPAPTDTPIPVPTGTPIPAATGTPLPTVPATDTPILIPMASDTPMPTPADTPTAPPAPGDAPISPSVIAGVVLLQGRTVHAGTNVFLTEGPCPAPPGPPTAVTNEAGYFEITPMSGRSYGCLHVFRPGYLVGQRESPQGSLGTLTLRAGDLTQDNVIDMTDLDLIAEQYHSADPMADLNADGLVDIFDLSIVTTNFNRSGPVSDWQ